MSISVRLQNLVRLVRNADGARREAVRTHAFKQAHRLTPFVGVEHDGVRFVLSTRERGVGFPTFVFGSFDEDAVNGMLAALERHAGITTLNGLIVLNVGANIGTVAISLLVRHGVERVAAVEPDAENVRLLRANLALNGVQDRVEILQIALSDTDGTLLLERSESNCGDHRIRVTEPSGPDLSGEGQRATVEVVGRRLDSLAEANEIDLDSIDLVWMDAQGHEGHILAGAERLAAAGVPIVTEYWPYGLRRAGGLERFHAFVGAGYGFVVDLREPTVALDARRVAELADRYSDGEGEAARDAYTDILLLPRNLVFGQGDVGQASRQALPG
jgi:FkbM family methyltransferase